jgi:hypothetical protein
MARSRCSRTMAVVLALLLSQAAVPVAHADHLVDQSQVVSRLLDGARTREERVALFLRALSTPEAQATARSIGVDPARVRAAIPQLSDAELKDLADRASRANDVTAGYWRRSNEGLVILGVVLVLLAVIVLVAATQSNY